MWCLGLLAVLTAGMLVGCHGDAPAPTDNQFFNDMAAAAKNKKGGPSTGSRRMMKAGPDSGVPATGPHREPGAPPS